MAQNGRLSKSEHHWSKFEWSVIMNLMQISSLLVGLYHLLFDLETIGVSPKTIKAINLNSNLSYLIITIVMRAL
jgi:hypothetical protein